MSIYLYPNPRWDRTPQEVDIGPILDTNDNKCENWLIESRGKPNNLAGAPATQERLRLIMAGR